MHEIPISFNGFQWIPMDSMDLQPAFGHSQILWEKKHRSQDAQPEAPAAPSPPGRVFVDRSFSISLEDESWAADVDRCLVLWGNIVAD